MRVAAEQTSFVEQREGVVQDDVLSCYLGVDLLSGGLLADDRVWESSAEDLLAQGGRADVVDDSPARQACSPRSEDAPLAEIQK